MYTHKSWDFNGENYLVKSPGRSRAKSRVWRELWEFSSPFSGEGQAGIKGPARDLLDFQSSCSSSDTQMSQISLLSFPHPLPVSRAHHTTCTTLGQRTKTQQKIALQCNLFGQICLEY